MRPARRLFRLLLLAWPRRVRRDEGRELEEMFVRCLDETRRRSGPLGLALAILRGAADTLASAPAVHAVERRERARALEMETESFAGDPHMTLRPRTVGYGLAHLGRDARYAARVLVRDRAFTLTALFTLAICLAANAVAFGIVRSVLIRPLAIPEPDRIVLLTNMYPNAGFSAASPREAATGVTDYYDRLRELTVFEQQALYRQTNVTLGSQNGAERISALSVTPSFFHLLRGRPALGELFADDAGESTGDRPVIVSHGFWSRHLGGDPAAIGRTVVVDGVPRRVIGVMPADFKYLWSDVELWLTRAFTADERSDARRHSNNWVNIARLKPGATIDQAQREVDALNARNDERFPQYRTILRDAGFRTIVHGLQEVIVREVRPSLYMLWGGALLVLLIGGANLANLFLVRASGRAREFATRYALGAGFGRLSGQLVSEALLLTVIGGIAGVIGGWWAVRLLAGVRLDLLPRGDEISLDWQSALVVIALAALIAPLIGLAPLARLRHAGIHDSLREGGRADTHGTGARRTRAALASLQVGVAFVVLTGAVLLVASFREILRLDPGFQPAGVITAEINLPSASYAGEPELVAASDRLLATVRALPGVTGAGLTTSIPFGNAFESSVIMPEGYRPKAGESLVSPNQVTASLGYMESMRIPLRSGRYFGATDVASSTRAVIIDQRLAQRFWPGVDPVGKRLYFPSSSEDLTRVTSQTRFLTVVGVVGDVSLTSLTPGSPAIGTYYLPLAQSGSRYLTFAIRTAGDAHAVVPQLRAAVQSIDRELPVFGVQTMDERLAGSLVSRRVPMLLALGFGSVALFLAMIGVYGVLAYQVAQRQREIGIRLALGSSAAEVFRLVLRDGARITGAGLVLGVVGAFVGGRLIARLLYGVAPTDLAVFGIVAGIVAAIALAASVIPARRATLVDPVRALNDYR
jgi:predicted permease